MKNFIKKLGSIFKNEYVFSLFARAITLILGVINSILIARFLGSELKGTSTFLSSIISIGSIVITFGIHQVYPFFKKKYGTSDDILKKYINSVYVVFFVYLLIAVVLAVFLSIDFEIKCVIVFLPIAGFSNVVSYVYLIEKPNWRNVLWIVLSFVETALYVYLFIFQTRNIYFALLILFFADSLRAIVYTILLKIGFSISKGTFLLILEMFKIGFLPMIALLLTTLNYKVDTIMLKLHSNITEADIGVYSIGISVADKIVMVPDTLKGILVSKLSKGGNEEEVAKVSRLSFLATIIISVLFILFGYYGIELLYGSEYSNSYLVMVISSIGAIFIGYFKLIAQYNIVNKKQIRNIVLLLFSVALNIVLNLIFIPVLGINGAALTTGISHLVCGIVFAIWFAVTQKIKVREMFLVKKSDFKILKRLVSKNGTL